MDVIKTCPFYNRVWHLKPRKKNFLFNSSWHSSVHFLIWMLEKQYFLSIQQSGHERQGGMCIHRATLRPEGVLPRKIQGLTHRGPWVCAKILQNVYAYSSITASQGEYKHVPGHLDGYPSTEYSHLSLVCDFVFIIQCITGKAEMEYRQRHNMQNILPWSRLWLLWPYGQ